MFSAGHSWVLPKIRFSLNRLCTLKFITALVCLQTSISNSLILCASLQNKLILLEEYAWLILNFISKETKSYTFMIIITENW